MEKILTLKEVAQYIKLNERTILKMAHNNEIPAKKIGNQWRFVLSKVDDWLSEQIEKVDTSDLNALITTEPHIVPISRFFCPELIELNLKSENKEDLLAELSEIPRNGGVISDNSAFLNALKNREELMSTALTHGFAIPHPRYPVEGLFANPRIIFARSIKGISFGAFDGSKSHLFFISCAPSEGVHLRLLAKIGRLLRVSAINEKLMGIQTKDDFFKLLLDLEKNELNFERSALNKQ